jgi:cysteinyl-tRNA synthetase
MTSVWKLDDPAAMRLERLQKDAAKAEKEKQKEEARKKALEREEKARIPPQMMFKMGDFLAQFGEWDEQGLPTKNKVGEALSKGVLKKLGKEWEKQREAYEKLMARDSWRAGQREREGGSGRESWAEM